MSNLKYIWALCLVTLGTTLLAQEAVTYKIVGENIYANIVLNQPQEKLDSIAESFGFTGIQHVENEKSPMGWRFVEKTNAHMVLVLNKNQETKKLPNAYVIRDAEVVHLQPSPYADYGVNRFKNRTVFTKSGKTRFALPGYSKAQNVYLSGSFNDWSTLKTPMAQTADGWEVTLDLPPGKHLYKFIVDGRWMHDKQNRNKENDGNNGYNSAYFVYNYRFVLNGHQQANKVDVAGSFCNWQQIAMFKDDENDRWIRPMYLREGTHAYKFVVDGEWITDPDNDIVRDDGAGNLNSFTSVGDTAKFKLNGFHNAKQVFVAGSFNAWNFTELELERTFKGWQLPYVLAPGNYPYKYKVDDNYVLDPNNPITEGEGDYKNNIKVVEPNVTFTLRGYSSAETVRLSGSFNAWNEHGYTMERIDGAWRIKLYLPKGKHTYKFVVGDEWIADPENDLWERNEYDSRNSVLWVDEYTASTNP